MTKNELLEIQKAIHTELRAECAAAGIKWQGNNVGLRRTAKVRGLLTDMSLLVGMGSVSLQRWAAHGVSLEELQSAYRQGFAIITSDRFRQPSAAKIR